MSRTAAVLLLLLGMSALAADPPKYIEPQRTAADLTLHGHTLRATFPLAAPANIAKPEIEHVYLGDTPATRLGATVDYQTTGDGRAWLIVTIPEGAEVEDGTYALTLRIVPKTGPKTPQMLALQMKHAAATVAAIGPVYVDVVRMGIGEPKTTAAKLPVRETSGRSELSNVRFTQIGVDKREATGRVDVKPVDFVLPGQSQDATYSLDGSFPIGLTTAKMELTAPQLASAHTFNVEIRTRRHWWMLLATIIGGLILGFLVRVGLKRYTETRQARAEVYTLIENLQRERLRHEDATYRAAIAAVLAKLEAEIDAPDATKVKAASDEATEALNQLQQRKADALNALNELEELTKLPWNIPEGAAAALAAAVPKIAEARALAEKDATSAGKKAAEIRAAMVTGVKTAASAMVQDVRNVLRDLETRGVDVAPAKLRAKIPLIVPAVGAFIAGVPLDQPEPPLQGMLQGLHKLRHEAAVQLIDDVFAPAADDAAKLARKFALSTAAFTAAVDAAKKSGDVAPALGMELVNAFTAINETMTKEAAGKDDVLALIAAGDYDKAAAKLKPTLSPPAFSVTAGSEPHRPEASVPQAGTKPVILSVEGGRSLELLRAKTFRQIAAAKFLQWLLSAIGLIVIGLLTFAPKFEGTLNDFAAPFFWAFLVDISVDTLTEMAKGRASA